MSASEPRLPKPESMEAFLETRGDPQLWLPAMHVICERHGLDPDGLYAERSGTNVVFAVGREAWIKLIVPLWPEDFDRESSSLAALDKAGAVASPPLLGSGEIDGWPYLVLGTVPGESIVNVWSEIGRAEQEDLAEQIGAVIARLQALDVEELGALRHDWAAFMRRQREGCVERHAQHGADARWQAEIGRFLDALPDLGEESEPVFLHADITDEHVLVAREGGRWAVTGLIDFADAMLGTPLYEFAAPAVFLTQRQPWAQRALLRGYGIPDAEMTDDLARRLTGHVLLHRFSRLADLLRMGRPPRPRSMEELHESLWSLG